MKRKATIIKDHNIDKQIACRDETSFVSIGFLSVLLCFIYGA